jgi:hypothetical protein
VTRYAILPDPVVLPASTSETVEVGLLDWPFGVDPTSLDWMYLISSTYIDAPPDGASPPLENWSDTSCENRGSSEAPKYRILVPVAKPAGRYGAWIRCRGAALASPVRYAFQLTLT